jgi:hypothetical protein
MELIRSAISDCVTESQTTMPTCISKQCSASISENFLFLRCPMQAVLNLLTAAIQRANSEHAFQAPVFPHLEPRILECCVFDLFNHIIALFSGGADHRALNGRFDSICDWSRLLSSLPASRTVLYVLHTLDSTLTEGGDAFLFGRWSHKSPHFLRPALASRPRSVRPLSDSTQHPHAPAALPRPSPSVSP